MPAPNETRQKAIESHSDLVTPLLPTCDSENEPYCDERETQAVWLYCGATWDYILQGVVSILLPTLLTIQFRLACAVENFSHYPMMFLYIQIFFFGLAGWLYRTSLQGDEHIVIQLWPEISTDLLLLLILYQQTATAIFLLDVISLALAIHAAWNYWDQLEAETAHVEASTVTTSDQDIPGCDETRKSLDSSMPLAVVL